ncbi:hypothetical protein [Microtetraspora sp. NBRC 16547]|uniref:hypothetical protein n=1 Tax=Microtetraspora sp. NBRC 16547 TaxID=3030993 RepID=UPI0024A28519|nr:hypothetical protein Misp02_61490 [Microtetraspora sp. NBRC 16547]
MIRILVAEDMRILRDTLVAVLKLEDDLDVVAATESGVDIVSTALAYRPDVAVISVDLPSAAGSSWRPNCTSVCRSVAR